MGDLPILVRRPRSANDGGARGVATEKTPMLGARDKGRGRQETQKWNGRRGQTPFIGFMGRCSSLCRHAEA